MKLKKILIVLYLYCIVLYREAAQCLAVNVTVVSSSPTRGLIIFILSSFPRSGNQIAMDMHADYSICKKYQLHTAR